MARKDETQPPPGAQGGPFPVADFERWMDAQVAFGPRRPGSAGGAANEDFLEATLRSFGVDSVRREPIAITAWESAGAGLTLAGSAVDAFAIPYTAFTPPPGVAAPLVYADPRRLRHSDDWRGRIVVTDITFPALDAKLLLKIALDTYDPDATLADVAHPATWVRQGWHLYDLAARRGAVGFIGILADQPGGTCRMYAPYGFREKDILDKPLPGLWVGRDAGARLRAAAGHGDEATLVSTGRAAPATTYNIVAEIGGASDEVVVLSCHHDSPFASPVEDASGVSIVLGLARHLAAARPLRRRVVVLFTAGHFYGSIGTRRFIATHRATLLPKVALEITIEHSALEAVEDAQGRLVPSGRPEAAALFMSVNRALTSALKAAVAGNDLRRCAFLPAAGPLGDYPPTDGGDWHEAGVPLVNYICNPVYLLTAEDDRRWVDVARMPRIAQTFADLMTAVDAVPLATLRAADRPVYRAVMTVLRHVARLKGTRFGLTPLW